MARRQRVDSISAAQAIAASAGREITPPPHVALDDGDLPFWQSVIAEFPKAEWTAHTLETAAFLAKAMADYEAQSIALRAEGFIIDSPRGPMTNPRHGVARDLSNKCMSWRRNLQLHARATGGEARDVGKRKAQAKAVEQGLTAADDDFIARPTLN